MSRQEGVPNSDGRSAQTTPISVVASGRASTSVARSSRSAEVVVADSSVKCQSWQRPSVTWDPSKLPRCTSLCCKSGVFLAASANRPRFERLQAYTSTYMALCHSRGGPDGMHVRAIMRLFVGLGGMVYTSLVPWTLTVARWSRTTSQSINRPDSHNTPERCSLFDLQPLSGYPKRVRVLDLGVSGVPPVSMGHTRPSQHSHFGLRVGG